jgi:hypothetical protein
VKQNLSIIKPPEKENLIYIGLSIRTRTRDPDPSSKEEKTMTKIPVSKLPSGHRLAGHDPLREFNSYVVKLMNSNEQSLLITVALQ